MATGRVRADTAPAVAPPCHAFIATGTGGSDPSSTGASGSSRRHTSASRSTARPTGPAGGNPGAAHARTSKRRVISGGRRIRGGSRSRGGTDSSEASETRTR
jgi:hypothetical protein